MALRPPDAWKIQKPAKCFRQPDCSPTPAAGRAGREADADEDIRGALSVADQVSGDVLAVRPFSFGGWRKMESNWKTPDPHVGQAGEGREPLRFAEACLCGTAAGLSLGPHHRER